jgi:UDP-N-acetylmuramoyl-tripeptide--D-alanyl-D-alanine ligase
MRWTDDRVRAILGSEGPAREGGYGRVWTDTRTIQAGDLFVALTGERFDGHTFLEAARELGARGAVVRKGTAPLPGLILHPVDDPLMALGRLARARRREIRGPVVAITGTNGKTSTKEMLAAALRTRYRTHATRANLNNLVGVPLTILEAPEDCDALVVEAGANLPGEIGRCREIIEPSVAVITNVAAGHLEGFGSLEGVLTEKLALAQGVPLAVVGGANPRLVAGARAVARRVVTAGLDVGEVVPDHYALDSAGRVRLAFGAHQFTLGLLGLHQGANAVIVWAVCRELGLDLERVAAALEGVELPGGRGQRIEHGELTILNDSYNANPASFQAAIELARSLRGDRRLVFVAGTMLELGSESDRLHGEIAAALVALEPDLLAGVGRFRDELERFRERLGDRLLTAPDAPALAKRLAPRLTGNELVVLKGSRGIALERIIPELLAGTPA